MERKHWVRIVGRDHPHKGEVGYIPSRDGKVTLRKVGDVKLYEVILTECNDGVLRTFAAISQLRPVRKA